MKKKDKKEIILPEDMAKDVIISEEVDDQLDTDDLMDAIYGERGEELREEFEKSVDKYKNGKKWLFSWNI